MTLPPASSVRKRDWFDALAHLHLIRALPSPVREACLAEEELRHLFVFRFLYFFAFHAPILVPALQRLCGRADPALAMLALGLASVIGIFAEVPTGYYADRHGPRAALRFGLVLMAGTMLGFCLLTGWQVAAAPVPGTAWLPGTIGIFVLEAAMGVALALISGADTVFFLQVASRAHITGLSDTAFEGIGAAIRASGTMIAVALGSLLYSAAALCSVERARALAQGSVFLLTFAAQVLALRALSRIRPVPRTSAARRPGGLGEAASALRTAAPWAERLWLLGVCLAVCMFLAYLLQAPLSRLTEERSAISVRWLVVYPVCMVLGWWAARQGARLYYAHTQGQGRAAQGPSRIALFLCAPALVLLYPGVQAGLRALGLPRGAAARLVPLLAAFLLANLGRGFLEPLSRTFVLRQAATERLLHPTTLVSAFSTGVRVLHSLLSVLFAWALARAAGEKAGDDAHIGAGLAAFGGAVTLVLGAGLVAGRAGLYAARRRSLGGSAQGQSDQSDVE